MIKIWCFFLNVNRQISTIILPFFRSWAGCGGVRFPWDWRCIATKVGPSTISSPPAADRRGYWEDDPSSQIMEVENGPIKETSPWREPGPSTFMIVAGRVPRLVALEWHCCFKGNVSWGNVSSAQMMMFVELFPISTPKKIHWTCPWVGALALEHLKHWANWVV